MTLRSFSEGISVDNKEPLPEKASPLKSFSETIDSYAWGKTTRQLRDIRATFNVDEPEAKRLLNVAKNQPEHLTSEQVNFFAKLLGKKGKAARYLKIRAERKKRVKKLFDLAFDPETILEMMKEHKEKWTAAEVKRYLIELGVNEDDINFEETEC